MRQKTQILENDDGMQMLWENGGSIWLSIKKMGMGIMQQRSFVQSFISFDLFLNFVINIAKSSKLKYIYKISMVSKKIL